MSNAHIKTPVKITLFLASLGIFLLLIWYREALTAFSQAGYVGIFLVTFLSTATVLFPVPGVAGTFISGAVWNPLIVGLVSAIGSTLGEVFGYGVGYGGSGLIPERFTKSKYLTLLTRMFTRAGFVTILIFSALPFPLFDVLGILAGIMNYPLRRFLLAVFLGRLIKSLILAFAGQKILM